MLHTPLAQVIQSLGKRERSELQRWVASPFINRRPEVLQLCQYLCDQIPIGENQGVETIPLSKVETYAQVLGALPAVKQRTVSKSKGKLTHEKLSQSEDAALRYTMSFLFSAVKQWMAYREWSKDGTTTGLQLCRALRKKGLMTVFEKEFKILQSPDPNTQQSTDFHLAQYQLQLEHWESKHQSGQADRIQLQQMCGSFGAFVAVSALRHGCAALDKSGGGLPFETVDFLPEALAKVEAGQYIEVPTVQVYYYCFRLMQVNSEPDFQQLKSLLTAHSAIFPPEEIRDVWLVAINYCIRRLNAGERDWVREAFELYRSGLERDLLLDNGKMPKATYQNIMLLAIASDAWDWARQFLEDYRPSLAIGERYNAYQFNLALWHFRRKAYPEAQEILRSVEFRDVHYNLDARRMMLRMYYDEGAISALDSLLHSFRTYLLRHRNLGYHRELNANFVRAVQQMLRLSPGDAQARDQLRQKIIREKYLAEREWLLGVLG